MDGVEEMDFKHISVLLDECIEGLKIKENGVYVDGTLGGAGHSFEICKKLNEDGLLIGIDQDIDAIRNGYNKLEKVKNKVEIVNDNYENFRQAIHSLGINEVDGILLDLGVSSHQIDAEHRGFSYMVDAPLDMRMDQSADKTAADIVNTYSEADLLRILRNYGEEKFAKNIVKNIVKYREEQPIQTTKELVNLIDKAVPTKYKIKYGHPAKRTFQAIRIELNRELDVLKNSIDDMIKALRPGGRICIITFHSLEDRIVKDVFRRNQNPCTCPSDFPICVCGNVSTGKVITRKPILPTKEEMEANSRSRSAKLRIFEKVGEVDE